jgi:hypothetical protein
LLKAEGRDYKLLSHYRIWSHCGLFVLVKKTLSVLTTRLGSDELACQAILL